MVELHKRRICAVVTTFFPDDSVLPCITRVMEQVDHVIIVDDTGRGTHEFVHNFKNDNVTYLRNAANSGIAKSLNTGVNKAIESGYQWILTLDDDSLISRTYVSELVEFCDKNGGLIGKLGVIALSRGSDKERRPGMECQYFDKRSVITSGSLFHAEAFESTGGFNEEYFIDLVDFDFCTKLRKNGYKIVQLTSTGMQHKVGNLAIRKIFGISVAVYNHHPFRLYYQVRNSLLFFKGNVLFSPFLSFYLLLDVIRIPLKVVFFEDMKAKRLGFIFRGLRDGLIGKTGRIVERE